MNSTNNYKEVILKYPIKFSLYNFILRKNSDVILLPGIHIRKNRDKIYLWEERGDLINITPISFLDKLVWRMAENQLNN